MKKILVVDDERPISDIIKFNLTKEGYEVVTAFDGREALEQFEAEKPDLVILDLMLPELDGLEVAKEIRKTSHTPIIMLSAKDEEMDKIIGLTLGADDYVTKPFRPLELIARVKAQLRRYKKYSTIPSEQEHTEILTYKKLALNTKNYECSLDGEPLSLTPTEFAILRILLEKQGMVISLEDLFHTVWKDEYYSKNSSTITVHIRHLREKLKDTAEKPQYIKIGNCETRDARSQT